MPPRPAEWILEGPSETGKTYASLQFLDTVARHYRNARGAIVRKWHIDLASTVLDLYKREFIEPAGDIRVFGGESPVFYEYPTGTKIWVAGIDRPGRVLSGALDFVYVNQAEELEVGDWETLSTRVTGRAGVIVPGILFGDMNPGPVYHWLYQREIAESIEILSTTHKDNPSLYDGEGKPTVRGLETIARLSKLTGTRRVRLFEGKRATLEGTIYAEFDRSLHVKRRLPSEFQAFLLALDAGYDHPAVILLIGADHDLRLHIFKESYASGVLPSKHANQTLAWSREHHAGLAVADPSAAGLIAELRNVGMKIETPEIRDVEQGIDLVHELLAVQADKRPRLTVDPECVNTINELESYRRIKGRIVKENDHAMDALRYLCVWLFGDELERNEVVYDRVRIGREW